MFRKITILLLGTVVAGCSSMSTITSPQAGTHLMVKEKTMNLPSTQKLKGTSFGNYEFAATNESNPTMYGILPLKFKGKHLAADIILFAPATMFNLRAAFPFYDIDLDRGIVRYKERKEENWSEYKPKPEEVSRARSFFEQREKNGG